MYQTFRVLRIHVRLVPLQAFTVTNSGGVLAVGMYVNNNFGLVNTFQSALESPNSKAVNLLTPDTVSFTITPTGGDHMNWTGVGGAMTNDVVFGAYLISSSASPSVVYFQMILDYDVEFKSGC